ncbi:DUF1259 domain-containing protein [Streptomyces sp. PTD5-9]|uniref:DUF1259 domain-containing protein n=1 Tax=Streptomyces sp. PTD5-9 TaxID=3120150 RepID=UPI003009703A
MDRTGDRRQDNTNAPASASRRRVLAAAALAPVLGAVAPAAAARTPGAPRGATAPGHGGRVPPAPSRLADWAAVAKALGRAGNMLRGTIYHTGFPRWDLHVVTEGVHVSPGLALGTHVAFVRYADGSTMLMGDVAVTEGELQRVIDAWQAHGIEQSALHKHLLAQSPDIWWAHVHAHGYDPVALARGLRAGLDRTGTPPARPPRPTPVDLDIAGMEAVLGTKGVTEEGLYKALFARRETIADRHLILPPGLGSTSALNFQPMGGGRAALAGDCVMLADEVPAVLKALRRGGIQLVELHNHHLAEEPRLFFTHFWAVDDGVALARAVRPALDATDVVPIDAGPTD